MVLFIGKIVHDQGGIAPVSRNHHGRMRIRIGRVFAQDAKREQEARGRRGQRTGNPRRAGREGKSKQVPFKPRRGAAGPPGM